MAQPLEKSKSIVHFDDAAADSNASSINCKHCGDSCGLILYKAFASTYVSITADLVDELEALELIDLNNNDSMIAEKSNYQDGTDGTILRAKRKYLRYHHKQQQLTLNSSCRYKDKCIAFKKAQNTTTEVLNGLSELEQAHLIFYHPNEFDKRWIIRNRRRNGRYLHNAPSNKDSNSNSNAAAVDIPMQCLSDSNSKTSTSLQSNLALHPLHTSGSSFSRATSTLSAPGALHYTKSVKYHKLLVTKQKNKAPATDVLLFGFPFESKTHNFKNPKQEVLQATVLNNQIRVCEWNNLLRSCARYLKMRNALVMRLNLKEVIALKLYTDFDELQRQFRRCFRIIDVKKRIEMQKNFVHWNGLLVSACKKAKDDIGDALYHGVASLNKASSFNGKYYGPVSTTTILEVAKQFSGDQGTVLVLHSAYSMAGVRLSWLSNYPDEDEVLYMNVTFQITDIIDPNTEKSKLWRVPSMEHGSNQAHARYEKELEQIKNDLQAISINSNVLSLNETQLQDTAMAAQNVMVINKISILNLLYLQYKPKRWEQICDDNTQQFVETLNALRQQFVHLIENIKAVQMDRTSPLIQDFFSSDQKEYAVPSNIHQFNNGFKQETHHFKLQTVIRLFPEAEEIGINAKNWDFTLQPFVEFLMKWRYDYTPVALKYISIKFDTKDGNKTCESDERAIQELEKHYASANISKLSTLGWKFLTPSRLSRVPFDPGPELPFLLSFVQDDNRDSAVFYRSNTLQLLNRDPSHKSLEGCVDEDEKTETDQTGIGTEKENVIRIHHNPKICILSTAIWDKIEYKEELTKLLNKVRLDMLESPQAPGILKLEKSRSVMIESFQRACDDVKSLTLDPIPNELIKIFKPKDDISYQAIYDVFPNASDLFLRDTEFTLEECERLCAFLKEKQDTKRFIPFERIFYKDGKESEEEKATKDISTPFDRLKKSASRLGSLRSFVFTEEYEYDDDQNQLHRIAKMLKDGADWSFQDNGQIAFCNDIYKHHQNRNAPYVISKV